MVRFIVPIYLLIVLAGGTGWVKNIIAVAHSDFSNINGELVLRVIGIPMAPLGAIIGWIP